MNRKSKFKKSKSFMATLLMMMVCFSYFPVYALESDHGAEKENVEVMTDNDSVVEISEPNNVSTTDDMANVNVEETLAKSDEKEAAADDGSGIMPPSDNVDLKERDTAPLSSGTTLDKVVVNCKGKEYDLLNQDYTEILDLTYTEGMTLNIEATFGAGADKTIEVSIPKGLAFREDYNREYAVKGTDLTLKEKINPNKQTDDSKKNIFVLGTDQSNGTITLKYFGRDEKNDAKNVKVSIPIFTAFRDVYNKELWNSGTAWFYDEISKEKTNSIPITVSQSINGNVTKEVTLDKITIKNDENKIYSKGWKASYNPQIIEGGEMSGSEFFYTAPIPNGGAYTKRTAFTRFSITYLAPEGAKFEKFSTDADYNGAAVVETKAGEKTENGYTVPEGYTGYTWSFNDKITYPQEELKVYPIWSFADKEKFPSGSTAKISVVDVKARYYGRDYKEGEYEPFDSKKFPSLTYDIVGAYEEVFSLVKYDDPKKYTDGYESDSGYNLNMGSPGYEFIQERGIGYFTLGNRGTADSAPKTLTINYDRKGTNAVGVMSQEIPKSIEEHKVEKVQYKLWDSKTGKIDDEWSDYTGTASHIHLSDLGVALDSGKYIKSLKFNLSTIPARSYLIDGPSRNNHSTAKAYKFWGRVLSEKTYELKNWGPIEHRLEIANTNGDLPGTADDKLNSTKEGQNSAYTTIVGRAYNGLTGKSLIIGHTLAYEDKVVALKTGSKDNHVVTSIHHYQGNYNGQLLDAVYMISPFGEPYENIKVHTKATNWSLASIRDKYYKSPSDIVQPEIKEMEPTEAIKAKYPKARLYKLDFTGITDPVDKYHSRLLGRTSIQAKTWSNMPLSTGDEYNGLWISFDYSPNLSDPEGFFDDVFWAEFNGDTDYPITYAPNLWYRSLLDTNKFNLENTGKVQPGERLSRLNGLRLVAAEGLEVSSSIKQKAENDTWYRTYKEGEPSTIMGMYSDTNYKLTVANNTAKPSTGISVYWAIPKKGEDWGKAMNPEGAFAFTMSLKNALKDVPEGFVVEYAKNAKATGKYEEWSSGNKWYSQDDVSGWKTDELNEINFVRLVWKGTEDKKTIDNGDKVEATFDLTLDTTKTAAEDLYKVNVWSPYFLRHYSTSSSWITGEPVAAMATPGKLGGYVWEDKNFNGVMDEGEPTIENAKVELYDISTEKPVLRVVGKTDKSGKYLFDGLIDGTATSGKVDNCKIIVYNPSTDLNEDGSYIAFTKAGKDMTMKPEIDQKSASAIGTPAVEESKYLVYNAGLLKGIPVEVPTPIKEISGDSGDKLNDISFNYNIEGVTGSEPLPKDAKGKENTGAERSVAKLIKPFGTINFKAEGKYTYYITEAAGASEMEENFKNDTSVYLWTVNVKKDKDTGEWTYSTKLQKKAEKAKDSEAADVKEMKFNNVFTFTPVEADDPPVKKIVKGNPDKAEEFKFVLKAKPELSELTHGIQALPMPNNFDNAEMTTTITGSGESEFGIITFEKPGKYVYEISEVNDGRANYKYDESKYTVTYMVTSEDNELVSKRIITKDGQVVDKAAFEFTNEYAAPAKPGVPEKKAPVTGDNSPLGVYGMLSAAALAALILVLRKRKPCA